LTASITKTTPENATRCIKKEGKEGEGASTVGGERRGEDDAEWQSFVGLGVLVVVVVVVVEGGGG
jgi:hypothetical protein